MKILIAGMGNVLRGDDGFGIRVAEILQKEHKFADGVDIYEAGIGGIGLVQELMNGYAALILIDAIDKGAEPGSLFVVEPFIGQIDVDNLKLHQSMVDMHYADPGKVIQLAKALNVCPPIVYLVGCQPEFVEDAVEGLRPSVERAVPRAVTEVISLVAQISQPIHVST
ncbi:MAG: hydrogenase maturation protease [Pyrinomonadaceae bacterium]